MAKTGKLGMVGHKPKVLITPAKDTSGPTPEQKAKARAERRKASASKR